MSNNSRLPWTISKEPNMFGQSIIKSEDDLNVAEIINMGSVVKEPKANAELIVKAVNNHDQLRKSLALLINAIDLKDIKPEDMETAKRVLKNCE